MGLLRKVTGKTVSRKGATAQRKTFLHFDLILNRKDAKGAKVFFALRAGYLIGGANGYVHKNISFS